MDVVTHGLYKDLAARTCLPHSGSCGRLLHVNHQCSCRQVGESDNDADAVLFAISKERKNWLQCAPGFGVRVTKSKLAERAWLP